jgi:hypothetical protein
MIVYTCPSCDEMAALQDSQGGTRYACLRCGTVGTVPVKEGRDLTPAIEPRPEPVAPEPAPPMPPLPQPAPPRADCPPPPPLPPTPEPPPPWRNIFERRFAQSAKMPDLSTVAMVCGLLGVIPCCGAVPGLLGVVLGVSALSQNLPHRERAVIGILAGLLAPLLGMAIGWAMMMG